MDRESGIQQIKKACNAIAVELMRIHPAVPALGNKETEEELYRTLFQITKDLETIKKRILRLSQSAETKPEDQPEV